ncbi:hypothetical protein ACKW6Q_08680 [Chryseobacterium kwangjuense]|uniref:DUF4468 domain-containing protein n=1 Tax=Chryseobacterium kwangjuense TaxID=267125 RepID=A0ABW9K1L2_9FLAO
MKKITVFTLMLAGIAVLGQKVSDYKYISVPEKLKDFENKEPYGLEALLAKGLAGKKYIVVQTLKDWPAEAKDNPCSVGYANVSDNSSILKNKVLFEIKDCNQKVIFSAKGASNIKSFKEGFQDALKEAIVAVPVSNPVEIVQTVKTEPVSVPSENKSETAPSSSVSENKSEKYTNGKLDLQKIQVDASQFILAESGSSVPFAVFKASSKRDVFRVKLRDGSSTIGYFENGNIVIDMPQSGGDFTKEVFSGK